MLTPILDCLILNRNKSTSENVPQASTKGSAGVTQPSDIVRDLSAWLEEASTRGRRGGKQEIEVDLVRQAIAEISGLREALDGRRGTSSIAAEDLNASNDE
jgi:hypothetical protein